MKRISILYKEVNMQTVLRRFTEDKNKVKKKRIKDEEYKRKI